MNESVKIKLLAACVVEGEVKKKGAVITVKRPDANLLCGSGHAEVHSEKSPKN